MNRRELLKALGVGIVGTTAAATVSSRPYQITDTHPFKGPEAVSTMSDTKHIIHVVVEDFRKGGPMRDIILRDGPW
jgi:hypothetical protein